MQHQPHQTSFLERHAYLLGFAVIFIATVLLYLPLLWFGYTWDEYYLNQLVDRPFWDIIFLDRDPANTFERFYFRPFGLVVYWCIRLVTLLPWLHYAVNILLHAGVGYLIFSLIYRGSGERRSTGVWIVAVLAAFFFCAHVISSYSMLWIAQRFDLLAALFMLLALKAAVSYWQGKRTTKLLLFVGMWAALAAFSKETAYTLPLLFAAFYIIDRATGSRSEIRPLRKLIPLGGVTVGVLAVVFLLRTLDIDASYAEASHLRGLPSMIRTSVTSIFIIAQPFNQYTFDALKAGEGAEFESLTYALSGVSIGVHLLFILGAAWGIKVKKFAAGLLPFIAMLSVIILAGWVEPRLLYLHVAMFLAGLGIVAVRSRSTHRLFIASLALCAAVSVYFTWEHIAAWKHIHDMPQPEEVARLYEGESFHYVADDNFWPWYYFNGGIHAAAVFTYTDHLFDRITGLQDEEPLAISRDGNDILLRSRHPHRFFKVIGGNGLQNSYPLDGTAEHAGVGLTVTDVFLNDRPREIRLTLADSVWGYHGFLIHSGRQVIHALPHDR